MPVRPRSCDSNPAIQLLASLEAARKLSNSGLNPGLIASPVPSTAGGSSAMALPMRSDKSSQGCTLPISVPSTLLGPPSDLPSSVVCCPSFAGSGPSEASVACTSGKRSSAVLMATKSRGPAVPCTTRVHRRSRSGRLCSSSRNSTRRVPLSTKASMASWRARRRLRSSRGWLSHRVRSREPIGVRVSSSTASNELRLPPGLSVISRLRRVCGSSVMNCSVE